jgi:hypothetical protein
MITDIGRRGGTFSLYLVGTLGTLEELDGHGPAANALGVRSRKLSNFLNGQS